jgi:hypothetical protein
LAEPASRRDTARIARGAGALALCAALALGAGAARGASPVPAADCIASPHDRIILSADTADPDVFVWDDQMRLVEYSLGQWSDTRSIMVHTVLAHPGTQAVVLTCLRGAVHARYAAVDEDAVRLRLTSGPYRGRFGWVSSRDVHPAR